MSIAIHIPGGILHLAESKAICPHCEHKFPISVLEPLLEKSRTGFFRKKCVCGRFVGITTDYHGYFVAYDLKG